MAKGRSYNATSVLQVEIGGRYVGGAEMAHERQIILIGFLQAANCSNYPASWRHPASHIDFLSPEYYQRIARILEYGKFHMVFVDDRLAIPDRWRDSYVEAVREGIRCVKLDLVPVAMAMALATAHLGIGITYSTTYSSPFQVARTFATLDHFSGGRIAWNIVTSLNDSEAANCGITQHPEHDIRYDMADEFMEVVTGLWETWDDGAILVDRQLQVFADPAKVRRLNFEGIHYKCRGPLSVPKSPQGYPVLMQAGQSARGRAFAARWGEVIFTIFPNETIGREVTLDIRTRAERLGRNASWLKVVPAVYVMVGETEAIAREKAEFARSLAKEVDSLVLLCEALNYDLSAHNLDESLPEGILSQISGLRSIVDRVVKLSGSAAPSVRDIVRFSGRGTLDELPTFVGTARQVADQMEAWFAEEICDGFVIAAPVVPGAYEDVVRLVVPELVRRGLFHKEYEGRTLRENLGLPPSVIKRMSSG